MRCAFTEVAFLYLPSSGTICLTAGSRNAASFTSQLGNCRVGTRFAGYHRSVYYDPYIKAYRFYYRPVYADTYAQEKEERIRVSFKDGKATVIEQSK